LQSGKLLYKGMHSWNRQTRSCVSSRFVQGYRTAGEQIGGRIGSRGARERTTLEKGSFLELYQIDMSNIDLSQLVGGKNCTVLYYIFNNRSKVFSFVLADTGANILVLINTQSTQATSQFLSIPIEHLPNPIFVQGFNRVDTSPITSILQLYICVDRQRLYNAPFLITDLVW
jgi:hypothetical protein